MKTSHGGRTEIEIQSNAEQRGTVLVIIFQYHQRNMGYSPFQRSKRVLRIKSYHYLVVCHIIKTTKERQFIGLALTVMSGWFFVILLIRWIFIIQQSVLITTVSPYPSILITHLLTRVFAVWVIWAQPVNLPVVVLTVKTVCCFLSWWLDYRVTISLQ